MLALLTTLLTLLAVGAIGSFVLNDMLLARLRWQHPDIWQALGPPSKFFDDGGLATFSAVREFWRRPDYQQQCNEELRKLVRVIRIYDRVLRTAAIVGLALAGVFVWSEG